MANGHGGFASGTPGARISELEEENKKLREKIEKLCQCDAKDGYTCAGHRA